MTAMQLFFLVALHLVGTASYAYDEVVATSAHVAFKQSATKAFQLANATQQPIYRLQCSVYAKLASD